MMTSKLKTLAARKASGFSLLELLLVVAVAAVLILAGVAAYSLVSGNQKAADAKRQIAQIKSTIKANYPNGGYGTGSMTSALGNMGAYTGMKGTAAAPLDPWGGNVTVTGADTSYDIKFASLPRKNCVDVVMSMGTDPDLTGINGGTADTDLTLPLQTSEAVASCTAANGSLTLTFK